MGKPVINPPNPSPLEGSEMSIEPDDDWEFDDPDDCYRCNGEGFVWSCFDGSCVEAEEGCDDCTRPCPECARRKRDNQQAPVGQTLGDVLAEALTPTPPLTAEEKK